MLSGTLGIIRLGQGFRLRDECRLRLAGLLAPRIDPLGERVHQSLETAGQTAGTAAVHGREAPPVITGRSADPFQLRECQRVRVGLVEEPFELAAHRLPAFTIGLTPCRFGLLPFPATLPRLLRGGLKALPQRTCAGGIGSPSGLPFLEQLAYTGQARLRLQAVTLTEGFHCLAQAFLLGRDREVAPVAQLGQTCPDPCDPAVAAGIQRPRNVLECAADLPHRPARTTQFTGGQRLVGGVQRRVQGLQRGRAFVVRALVLTRLVRRLPAFPDRPVQRRHLRR